MTTCGKCGGEYESGKNCPACNRRRVYDWRLANRERWREIQRESKRRYAMQDIGPRFCRVCGVSIDHMRRDARTCSRKHAQMVSRYARYQRQRMSA